MPAHISISIAHARPRSLGTRTCALAAALALLATGCGSSGHTSSTAPSAGARTQLPNTGVSNEPTRADVPSQLPRTAAPLNIYSADGANDLSPVVRGDPALVYIPNSASNTVTVINQKTYKVVDQFATGALPQHVTPSYDLRTLYVDNDAGNSLTPINPRTARPGRQIHVEDPYNLYFTPDGRFAIVVAERLQRLDFRDPRTMRLIHSLSVPTCTGVDHMDFSPGGRFAFASCEFAGRMIKVDLHTMRVVRSLLLADGHSSPQDVKLSPDGRTLYTADQAGGGVWEINPSTFRVERFLRTGAGAHGLYPSRNATELYVSNRAAGSISVVSFTDAACDRHVAYPPVPPVPTWAACRPTAAHSG